MNTTNKMEAEVAVQDAAEVLLGLMGRLNEFKTNMHGEITDGDDSDWTPDDLLAAIGRVREMVQELDVLASFAKKAKEMSE